MSNNGREQEKGVIFVTGIKVTFLRWWRSKIHINYYRSLPQFATLYSRSVSLQYYTIVMVAVVVRMGRQYTGERPQPVFHSSRDCIGNMRTIICAVTDKAQSAAGAGEEK